MYRSGDHFAAVAAVETNSIRRFKFVCTQSSVGRFLSFPENVLGLDAISKSWFISRGSAEECVLVLETLTIRDERDIYHSRASHYFHSQTPIRAYEFCSPSHFVHFY